jgi:integral membrane sensor domain MASE1
MRYAGWSAVSPRTRPYSISNLRPAIFVGIAYYVGCLAGFALRYPGSGISFFWPPTAVLTAILLIAAPGRWVAFLASSLVAHAIAHTTDGILPLSGWCCSSAMGPRRCWRHRSSGDYSGGTDTFTDARRILIFIVGACWLAPAIASLLPAITYVSLGWADNVLTAWRARTVSNAIATLTIVPSLYMLWPRWLERPDR